jgi:hypothetical protein
MIIDRRHLIFSGVTGVILAPAILATRAAATPLSALGVDAAQFGVRPGTSDDQTLVLIHCRYQGSSSMAPGCRCRAGAASSIWPPAVA